MSTPNTWTLTVQDGTCWIQTYQMPNPGNQSVESPVRSTKNVVVLHDGSKAFVGPATKYTREPISFEITEYSSNKTMYDQFEDYVINHRRIIMVTHDAFTYTGYFMNSSPVKTLSGSTQRYVLKLTFEPE